MFTILKTVVYIMSDKLYELPNPILDKKELSSLNELTNRYKKLIEPSKVSKAISKAMSVIPESIKEKGASVANQITSQELYRQTMELISMGFNTLEEQVAKLTISEAMIIKNINKESKDIQIESLIEICLVRSYIVSKTVNKNNGMSRLYAVIEGGATGVFGFWGLPFNLAFSTLLYFRAVQTIAMYYGYDVKKDESELIIASEVFTNALSPRNNDTKNELSGIIGKVMVMSEAAIVKQTAKKTWTDMAAKGGIPLLLTQMRALANKAAKKALEKAGQKGLEQSLFKGAFEQIGKKLTQKVIQRSVPVVSGALGALIDLGQMNQIVEFADVFYQKRFIMEKQGRIDELTSNDIVIDAEFTETDNNDD